MPDHLSPKQFAEKLGVPLSTVYRWIREGRLAAARGPGRRVWISRAVAQAFRPPVGVVPPRYSAFPGACPREELLWGTVAAAELALRARAREDHFLHGARVNIPSR